MNHHLNHSEGSLEILVLKVQGPVETSPIRPEPSSMTSTSYRLELENVTITTLLFWFPLVGWTHTMSL